MSRWRILLVVALVAVGALPSVSSPAGADTRSCTSAALFSAHGASPEGAPAILRLWSTGDEEGDAVLRADGIGEIGRTTLRQLPEGTFWSATAAEVAPTTLPRGLHRITATIDQPACDGPVTATTFHVVYGGSDARVDGAYAAILGRPADESGLSHFSGRPMGEIVTALLASQERPEAVVRQVYRRYLSREPDPTGLAHWTAQLRGGMAPEQLVTTVFGFGDQAGPGFLYEAFLDRAVTFPEAQYWSQVWMSGRDPEPAIFASDEARSRAVAAAYQSLLGRDPDAGGRSHWVRVLPGGWPSSDLLGGLLRSGEYEARHA